MAIRQPQYGTRGTVAVRVLPATSHHHAYLHHLDPAGFLRENRPWSDLPWLCQVANSSCVPSSHWWLQREAVVLFWVWYWRCPYLHHNPAPVFVSLASPYHSCFHAPHAIGDQCQYMHSVVHQHLFRSPPARHPIDIFVMNIPKDPEPLLPTRTDEKWKSDSQ